MANRTIQFGNKRIVAFGITHTDLSVLFSSPYELIPAQGANKVIVIDRMTVRQNAAFASDATGIQCRYTNGAGIRVVNDIPVTTAITETWRNNLGITHEMVLNAPVVLYMAANTAVTSGGTIYFVIEYTVYDRTQTTSLTLKF